MTQESLIFPQEFEDIKELPLTQQADFLELKFLNTVHLLYNLIFGKSVVNAQKQISRSFSIRFISKTR